MPVGDLVEVPADTALKQPLIEVDEAVTPDVWDVDRPALGEPVVYTTVTLDDNRLVHKHQLWIPHW